MVLNSLIHLYNLLLQYFIFKLAPIYLTFWGKTALYLYQDQNLIDLSNNFDIHLLLNNIVIGSVGIIGTASSVVLLVKNKQFESHNFYLGLFLLSISLFLIEILMFWIPSIEYMPQVILYRVVFFTWGPSYYLYLYSKLINKRPNRWSLYIHYFPFFMAMGSLFLLGNFVRTPSLLGQLSLMMVNSYPIKLIHILSYVVLGTLLIQNSREKIKKEQLTTALWLTLYMNLMTLILFARIFSPNRSEINQALIYVTIICMMVYVMVISFSVLTSIGKFPFFLIGEEESEKYKHSPLTSDTKNFIRQKLIVLLKEDKIYLDNSISLEKISTLLDVDRYAVSQVINQEFEKNFYELMNDYRIDHAVAIIDLHASPHLDKVKVIDLVYDSGFNNKVSFYKAFKHRKNMTPKAYMKKAWGHEELHMK